MSNGFSLGTIRDTPDHDVGPRKAPELRRRVLSVLPIPVLLAERTGEPKDGACRRLRLLTTRERATWLASARGGYWTQW